MNAEEFLKENYNQLYHFLRQYETGFDFMDDYANQSKPYSEVIANQAIQKNKITKYISIFKDVIKTYLEIENQKSNEK